MATGLLLVVTSVALLLRPPGAGAPAAALRAPALRRAPRLGAPPRCADDDDDEKDDQDNDNAEKTRKTLQKPRKIVRIKMSGTVQKRFKTIQKRVE